MAEMTPTEILYQQEHLHDNRSAEVIGVVVTMAILSTAAVALRFLCRKQMKVIISYDDYFVLAALIFSLGLIFIVGYGVHVGTGRHFLAVGLDNARNYLKLQYIFQIIYMFTLLVVRLSILIFYQRLFPRQSTSLYWRISLYCILFVIFGLFISGTTAFVFSCSPISFFWTRTGAGHCVNTQILYYFTAAINIVCDIAILLLPMPIVWNLQMQRDKKIGIMGIFLLGGFACIASIVRIFYMHEVVAIDPTWTQVNPAIWSTVEPSLGIVSACLPVIGSAFRSKFGSLPATSWLSRSKRSAQGNSYVIKSGDRRNVRESLQKKPVVTATVYSRDTQSDEEMALPLTDVEPQR